MIKAFIIACLLIALVLVTQFDSVVTPLIIMVSVALSFIGVFLGLIVTHKPFSVIMTGMGVISLAGVVVNNAIVLLDYTNILRGRGLSCYRAIIRAGSTRFRPVLLTAITTVLGLVPMSLGISYDFRNLAWQIGGDSAQWWGAMSTCVIFGLVVATALTLIVVPAVYSLVFDFRLNFRSAPRKRTDRTGSEQGAQPGAQRFSGLSEPSGCVFLSTSSTPLQFYLRPQQRQKFRQPLRMRGPRRRADEVAVNVRLMDSNVHIRPAGAIHIRPHGRIA